MTYAQELWGQRPGVPGKAPPIILWCCGWKGGTLSLRDVNPAQLLSLLPWETNREGGKVYDSPKVTGTGVVSQEQTSWLWSVLVPWGRRLGIPVEAW